ncbi:MAG: hypothetical protein OSA78_01680 [Flavobacteriales bacterium]|nr:hypothetical protein [Flavobacteriales bacterium]
MVILSGMLCLMCWGAPEWPADGQADRDWVIEAIQWRMHHGIYGCEEVMPGLDALTLEWIAETTEFTVEINRSEWPFLEKAPELLSVLIQVKALNRMLLEVESEKSRRRALRGVRRVARKTDGLPVKAMRSDFLDLLYSSNHKGGH